ncbi:MAG TPA: DEAD/DEAH box helicase [Chthonomonas sp.]|uniref:DEAD/DEAH box helicase n=1 Tax=Chthonomonas sp. TaxID=2282153 RepID=UPI002B4B1E23|nr:DEAD/DEAH box helicase [Chthonomonas sp.]HLI47802.1 DEAD/DEAH box helicase [Chthonomonas sp.]
MDFDGYLQDLRRSEFYRGQIAHVERIPGQSARYGELKRALHPELERALRSQGIRQFYSHQAEAINAALEGQHVTIVTSTASGKTLCYNVPVIQTVLEQPRARAFYLFPTKALAQDQLGKLNALGLFPTVRFASYDGDTSADERRAVRRSAHIVLTNPDMLHLGILPGHTQWTSFLANLRYVVIDEMHVYRGVFGAHVAQVLRRLRRLCRHYGANPQFLCCSATIANPQELTERLTGVSDPVIVDKNGAPAGRRTFVFWNPPLIDQGNNTRVSTHTEATRLFCDLVSQEVRTIVFTKARKSAELILRYARNQLQTKAPELVDRVAAYRAGYTLKERRQVEEQLFSGQLLGVASTNALELGIDIGGLQASILTGYPGSVASTWQQAGRAGRGEAPALSVLVAYDSPLEQFLMNNPDYFFNRTCEHVALNPDNPRILREHLLCAAYEQALSEEDLTLLGPAAAGCLKVLEEEGTLVRRGSRWLYNAGDYPAARVNIRSTGGAPFRIEDIFGKLVGTEEPARAFRALHPGAIYLHMGETYQVEELDIEGRRAIVRPAAVNYYTRSSSTTHLVVLRARSSQNFANFTAYFGEVVVTNKVVSYQRKKLYTEEVLSIEPLDLPEQTYETEALWFTVPASLCLLLARFTQDLLGSLHALEHAAIGLMPLLSGTDPDDVGGVSYFQHPDTALPSVFIYDGYPGGVGLAELAYENLLFLLEATRSLLQQCPCEEGCPSCVQSPLCGNNNQPLDKRGALELLNLLLGQKQSVVEARG